MVLQDDEYGKFSFYEFDVTGGEVAVSELIGKSCNDVDSRFTNQLSDEEFEEIGSYYAEITCPNPSAV